MPAEAALVACGARLGGLDDVEAARRLAQFGANRLARAAGRSAAWRLLAQFRNPLLYVLLAAAATTFLLGHWIDAGVILGVVVVNALIGFAQESRAERALRAVQDLLAPQASVRRGNERRTLPIETIVPGDIVLLAPGDRVPADLRLVMARELRLNEAALTGEAMPVDKATDPVPADAPLAERHSMAYAGCLVVAGQGEGMVAATGDATEIGRIGRLLAEVETLTTPLLRAFATFGRQLSAVILVLAALVFVFGWRVRDLGAEEMLMAAVSVAVAAIPEGLPAVLTIALAIGVERMARRNAIIRQLPAVETLGAVSVICTDKTGALTKNEMSVTSVALADATVRVSGTGCAPGSLDDGSLPTPTLDPLRELAQVGVLCNEAQLVRRNGCPGVDGDPTEGALIVLALRAGLDPAAVARDCPRLDLLPFAAETRLMATLHRKAEAGVICLKGAPEVVLPRCATERASGGPRPLEHDAWRARLEAIAARAERPLAIAVRWLSGSRSSLDRRDLESGFLLLGIVGIADPVRPEVVEAIRRCRSAGIRVKMITGDHPGTARAIAGTLGLANSAAVLTGPDLDRLDDPGLEVAAEEVDVFARTSPEHKLRLVSALQARGRIVAMTGDGVNDAPALKRADVGIAMGRAGTEAAKQAAKIMLADDNFTSIANAVEEGQTVHDNVKKAILFILPTSAAQAFAIVAAILLDLELPITPLQILWVNMVTAVTLALAIAFEAAEGDVMARLPRRPDEPLLSGLLAWRVLLVSLLLVAVAFGLFLWRTAAGDSVEAARAAAVNGLVVGQAFYLVSTRRLSAPASLRGARPALVAATLVLGLQLFLTYSPPLQELFGTAAVGVGAWPGVIAGGIIVLLAVELEKAALRALAGGSRRPVPK